MFEQNINETIDELTKKFNEIKNAGYVESTASGRGNIGLTLENLLGKENDNFQIADYEGIELKVKHGFSNTYICLFSIVPTGSGFFETKRIRSKFGYPDNDYPNVKILYRSALAKYKNKLDSGYKVSQEVNRSDKRIYLCFYNSDDRIIDKETYWSFEDIEKMIERKLKYLAFIKAWPKRAGGKIYYKYVSMNIYKIKGFDTFLNLINQGKIRVNIQLGVYKSGPKIGQEHDHGISFGIKECDLFRLYDKYEVKNNL